MKRRLSVKDKGAIILLMLNLTPFNVVTRVSIIFTVLGVHMLFRCIDAVLKNKAVKAKKKAENERIRRNFAEYNYFRKAL